MKPTTTANFVFKYRLQRQNLISSIQHCKMWRNQWVNHKKIYPNEIAYTEYILDKYTDAFNLLMTAEEYLSIPILNEQYGKAFSKEMTFYKKNIIKP